MVEYKKSLYPIQECLGFIEHFVNKTDDFTKLYEYCQNEEEKKMMEELDQASKIMEKAFDQHFAQEQSLFLYLHKEQQVSFAHALIFACMDDQIRDIHDEIIHIQTCCQKDPYLFIKEIISSEKNCEQDDIDEDRLLDSIDDLLIDDSLKWQLFQIHSHMDAFIGKIEAVLAFMLPIYHQFDSLYEKFMQGYEQELQGQMQGMDSYHYAIGKLNIHISDEDIVVVPTISNMRSLTFLTAKKADDSSYLLIYWGIGTIRRIMMKEEMIDTETLCSALKLLSDRSKFDILRYVSNKKSYGAQIANELKLSTPTISYHMQSLLNAKLVSFQKENNRLYYQMNREYLEKLLKQVYEQLTK